MTEARRELARLLEPAYLDALEDRTLDDLRAMHVECVELENSFSYVRRLVQGRLDILTAEAERRSTGGSVDELVAALPEILAGREDRPPNAQIRVPPHLAPEEGVELPRELAHIITDDTLAKLPSLSDDELRTAHDELDALEQRISADRRALHGVIDHVERELAGRLAVEA